MTLNNAIRVLKLNIYLKLQWLCYSNIYLWFAVVHMIAILAQIVDSLFFLHFVRSLCADCAKCASVKTVFCTFGFG